MPVALYTGCIMPEASDPVLTRFGVRPKQGNGTPAVEVDRSTGLLHESGVAIPLVEEMIEMGARWRNLGAAATVLTESTDPPDPDLIRADAAWLRFGHALVTGITKADGDPVDPDIVRAGSLRSAVGAAATIMTRDHPDVPDPDLVRSEPLRYFNGYLPTDSAPVDRDQPQHDSPRLEVAHNQRLNAG
jgi:hypothetical protein